MRDRLGGISRTAALALLHLHQGVYVVTGGRVGHRLLGVPCLLLRTTGRRSGKNRTSALVYARHGDDYVVVGSFGGADRAPGWLHNVRARPQVELQVAGQRFPAVATVVEPDHDDYRRLWQLVNESNHERYDRYQARTHRRIPLVRLTRS